MTYGNNGPGPGSTRHRQLDQDRQVSDKKISARDTMDYSRRPAPGRLKPTWEDCDNTSSDGSSTGAKRGAVKCLMTDRSDLTTCAETKSLSDSNTSFQLSFLDASAESSKGSNHERAREQSKNNRTKKNSRFLSDASVHSARSRDLPLQPPKPSYRQREQSPPPRRPPQDLLYEEESRGRGYHHQHHPTGEYRGGGGDRYPDERRFYAREDDYYDRGGGARVERDYYNPRDNYYEDDHHRRGARRNEYDYDRRYDSRGYDRRYEEDRRYEPRYEPRHDEPRYDDRYDPRGVPDERGRPMYDRGYDPRYDPGAPRRDPYERDHYRDWDHGYNDSRRPYHEEEDRYPPRRRSNDYDPAEPSSPDRGREGASRYDDEKECLDDRSHDDRISQAPSRNEKESHKANLKDDALYRSNNSTSRPGAFQEQARKGQLKDDKAGSSTTTGPDDPIYIEVFPGVTERLRRTKETKEAVARDFYTPAKCFACNMDVFCIADVKYYICPECKCVSVLDDDDDGLRKHKDVGIAFGFETLFKMQSEIVHERGDLKPRS